MLQFFILGPTPLSISSSLPLGENKFLGAVTTHCAKHVLFIEKRMTIYLVFGKTYPWRWGDEKRVMYVFRQYRGWLSRYLNKTVLLRYYATFADNRTRVQLNAGHVRSRGWKSLVWFMTGLWYRTQCWGGGGTDYG